MTRVAGVLVSLVRRGSCQRAIGTAALAIAACVGASSARADDAKEQIHLYGIKLTAAPAKQVVPRDIATIVSTLLQSPTLPGGTSSPIPEDAEVRATLRGPSLEKDLELVTTPNGQFKIPPLTVAGIHTLDNIRLVAKGEVLMYADPETVVIEVIERLLITQVTARPLTAAEIREKGLVFDSSSFQAYNFTAAFSIAPGETINIAFPVILPTLAQVGVVNLNSATLPSIGLQLPKLATLIPDTLALQTQVPNLSVVGFALTYKPPKGGDLLAPQIPGVIVIPGDIGFLNQVFSVNLMVGNVAPEGSLLEVSDLRAEIVLPPGIDTVVNTTDDPLVMGRTAYGETARVQLVVQAGPDGKLGTADDIGTIGPGQQGTAEYIVEGRREGSHVVEMEISGTLNGLPVGPVPIRGRAAGAVLVRNPSFTLTFTHPEVVAAGEPYTLDVTVTNTSESPANFVTVDLFARNIVGARLAGDATKAIDFIAPGDSASISFDLVSLIGGKVNAATLDSDGKVAGRFALKSSVGELGIPLSPDSLVLPKEANYLPKTVREAAIGLLGKAYAVATAPQAALPKSVTRFSRKIVWDRAIETAVAGLRIRLHEPTPDSALQLAADFAGSNYSRIAEFTPKAADVPLVQQDYRAFDDLRRRSVRGDILAQSIANEMVPQLAQQGSSGFHRALAERLSYRPQFVSVLLSSDVGALPVGLQLLDASGRALGGTGDQGKIKKDIPFSDFFNFSNGTSSSAQMALIAVPDPGAFSIRLLAIPGVQQGTPLTLSLVFPDSQGSLRHVVYSGVGAGDQFTAPTSGADPFLFVVETAGTGPERSASLNTSIVDPAPSILGVVQQREADCLCEKQAPYAGRIAAVLF
ncbi:MAG: hypothetical protein ABL961_16640, partial [Vicinamibacterales bacterium]